MSTTKSAKTTAQPRRRGWRIPHSMPKDLEEYKKLREMLGPRAYHRNIFEWPRFSEEEKEKRLREFKEPSPGEIRAFRLRHGIPPDWKIVPSWDCWVTESPEWERSRPTPYSKHVKVFRIYSLNQEYFDEFHSECMDGRARSAAEQKKSAQSV